MFNRIAVTVNDLPETKRALDSAIKMALQFQASLLTVSVMGDLPAYSAYAVVVDPLSPQEMREERYRRHQMVHEQARSLARQFDLETVSHIVEGHEVKAIVELLREQQADLLIIGLHQHDFYIARLWSTAYELAQDAPCSVLGVH